VLEWDGSSTCTNHFLRRTSIGTSSRNLPLTVTTVLSHVLGIGRGLLETHEHYDAKHMDEGRRAVVGESPIVEAFFIELLTHRVNSGCCAIWKERICCFSPRTRSHYLAYVTHSSKLTTGTWPRMADKSANFRNFKWSITVHWAIRYDTKTKQNARMCMKVYYSQLVPATCFGQTYGHLQGGAS
jgi:hypothetical protein